ncbi:hypothetical protein C2G38_2168333 [Gigaspora rosea]|uniref:Uncharacterized protein n=1 Tax=Gigaspora rosea TaxID=44941 RepID=A0A397VQ08_9GLOM|nr:hypothetical protein C2G38_2168333 [Gigaspora rosea]
MTRRKSTRKFSKHKRQEENPQSSSKKKRRKKRGKSVKKFSKNVERKEENPQESSSKTYQKIHKKVLQQIAQDPQETCSPGFSSANSDEIIISRTGECRPNLKGHISGSTDQILIILSLLEPERPGEQLY